MQVLVDISQIKSANMEARKYYSGVEASKVFKKLAMLVNTPISRVIGSFFLGLNKPSFPVKLFTNKEEAVKWLKDK